jgi:hypothetical protein
MLADAEQTDLLCNAKDKLAGLTTYNDGKMKRYNLLFSVNGGAFILAKLIAEQGRIGHLTLKDLAMGAILFTAFMTWDIWRFGNRMSTCFFEKGADIVFTKRGRSILVALALLLIFAWTLAIWA